LALAESILGALSLRDVATGSLILMRRSRAAGQNTVGPFLPADGAIGGEGAVPVGDNRIARCQTRDGIANEGLFNLGYEVIERCAFEFGRCAAEGAR
jgi:hypothetical protein